MTDLKFTEAEALKAATDYFNGDELAAKVWVNKYALGQIVGDRRLFAELTPDDMHVRMACEFARIEMKFMDGRSDRETPPWGYPTTVHGPESFYEAMKNFQYIVPQGSVMFGAGNNFVNVSLSNCVVVDSPKDSWNGIQKTATELGNLFKRRAGVGIDISSLRPEGMKVRNAANTTSGAWSFAEHFSNITRMIGQNGRRGALMLTIDVRHPDVESFAKMKRDTRKVTGANISILISDDFMEAVEQDREWITRWPIEATVEQAAFVKTIRARDLWHTINESAWLSAEPGLIFADNYRRNLPAHYYPGFEFLTVNPCSEIGLSAYDSCRLVSINLKNFVNHAYTEGAQFDFNKFREMVRLAVRMSDDVVELEVEALTRIIDECDDAEDKALWIKLRQAGIDGRRVGLGTHGLADVFLGLGIAYDSGAAVVETHAIYETLRDTAYKASVELAKERGAFPAWVSGDESKCEFIDRLPDEIREEMADHGRRNISLLTMAPTGTVSLVSQTSSGIEPVFEFAHTRKKKIEALDSTARVDETDQMGDKWQHFTVFHHAASEWLAKNSAPDLPDHFVSASQVDPVKRIELQGVAQQFIDHGISSTINLPADTSIETIEELYMLAWKKGLKGVTVYRDGCRSGVLVTDQSTKQDTIQESKAPKRPKSLPCAIKRERLKVRGKDEAEDWTFLIGLLDGHPYEIFGGPSESIELPKGLTKGTVTKRRCEPGKGVAGRSNCYDLIIGQGTDDIWVIKDIASQFSPDDEDYGLITRIVSQELRHGVPVQHIVDQLARSDKAALNSFSKVMGRVLKKYIKEGSKSGESCKDCGSKLVFTEGCSSCPSCGSSKCS